MSEQEPVCFTCGSSVETAFENVLPDGKPCSPCRQRAMEALPALLPDEGQEETVETGSEKGSQAVTPSLHILHGFGGDSDDDPVRA